MSQFGDFDLPEALSYPRVSRFSCGRHLLPDGICRRGDGNWCYQRMAVLVTNEVWAAGSLEGWIARVFWVLGWVYWVHLYALAQEHRGGKTGGRWLCCYNHECIPAPRAGRHCDSCSLTSPA